MKRIFLILCVISFLGACASTQPSLPKIYKAAQDTVVDLQENGMPNTLTKEQKDSLEKILNFDKEEEFQPLIKYSARPITSVDLLTIAFAKEIGYDMKEISDFLELDLYVENSYCEYEFNSYKVFQVLDDFVLATGCKVTSYDECSISFDKIFMVPKMQDELYFDNKILTPPNNFCSTYVGIFEYEDKNKKNHIVPILAFLPKIIDKSQLENIQKSREESQKEIQK